MIAKVVVASGLVALLVGLGGAGALRAQQPDPAIVQLYQRSCASCHGPDGRPNPAMARSLSVPTLADSAFLAQRPDSALVGTVERGKGRNMPAFQTRLTREQIRALVAYVRSLSRRRTQ